MPDLPTGRGARLGAGAVVLVLLVAAFAWFRPDALVLDRTVDEELDPAVAAALAATAESTPTPAPAPTDTAAPTAAPTPLPSTSVPGPASPAPTPADAPASPSPEPSPEPSSPSPEPSPEPSPDPDPDPGPVALARGEWTSLEHETSGTVALLDDGGDLRLVLSDLATSNGPDLHVILSPKAAVPGDWFGYDDGATALGGLKGNRGTQVYDVPDGIDLHDVASVVIWCERFTVGFGVADLG